MNALLNRILSRYQPRVVVFSGDHGKSMTMAAAAHILRSQGKSVLEISQAISLESALLRQGRRYWRLNAFLQSVGLRPYADVVFVERDSVDPSEFVGIEKAIMVLCARGQLWPQDRKAEWGINCIVNADEFELADDSSSSKMLTFGIEREADYQAEFIELVATEEAKLTGSTDPRWRGMQAKIKHQGNVLPLRLTGGLGRPHVYAALAAVALSDLFGVHVLDALKHLREWTPLPGRMRLIPGIKKSLMIDDTYQIDPVSAFVTFHEASLIPLEKGKRRFAVIGEMDDLGSDSSEQHKKLGKALVDMGYQVIIGIGERATDVLSAAELAGLPRSDLSHFSDAAEAGVFIQNALKRGELVVLKGSAAQSLERVVKELMAFPLRAKMDLLQRSGT